MPRLRAMAAAVVDSAAKRRNHHSHHNNIHHQSSFTAMSSSPTARRTTSYHASTNTADITKTNHPTHHVVDLPPISPMSSMCDPHSRNPSADGSNGSNTSHASDLSRSSQACSRRDDRFSTSSATDSLEDPQNLFLRPSTVNTIAPDTRLQSNAVRGPLVNGSSSPRDAGAPVALRRALFERPPSPAQMRPGQSQSRESAFAGIAARGNLVDNFVASRLVPHPSTRHSPSVVPPAPAPPGMIRCISGKSLEIPRGKLEQLPVPRPVVPLPARPQTPSRLPRPRVFITPSPSRQSVVDAVAVTSDANTASGEAEVVTREIPRPSTPALSLTPSSSLSPPSTPSPFGLRDRVGLVPLKPTPVVAPIQDDEFYFSDEEHVEEEEEISHFHGNHSYRPATPTPSDMLSYKMRQAVSALRSISFQSHTPEDLETAWGQANGDASVRGRIVRDNSNMSNRWRRARGRISSKNGVQEYECHSEADARSDISYQSNFSKQRTRSRDQARHMIGVPLRGDHGSRQKRSLWTGARRDRHHSPQTRATELLVSNGHGLLAASTDPFEVNHALAAVPDANEMADRARKDGRRNSVDKYVEFIHASAQREARNRSQYKNFPSRMISKVFRRKWA